MPLTGLQVNVLRVIQGIRHPGSHVAGSLPLHVSPDSARESRDIDLFHDAVQAMLAANVADCAALESAGFVVVPSRQWSEVFRRARVTHPAEDGSVEIDWAIDAAWRFYPPITDDLLGWRLHDIDLACNKVLALAGRSESRDLVDTLAWAKRIDLATIVWAACGKDLGFNPLSLLEQMRRSARIDPDQLAVLKAKSLDPQQIKREWLALAERTETAISTLADCQPEVDVGVLFFDQAGRACWPDPHRPLREQGVQMHLPTVGGCVPVLRELS